MPKRDGKSWQTMANMAKTRTMTNTKTRTKTLSSGGGPDGPVEREKKPSLEEFRAAMEPHRRKEAKEVIEL